ncbi:MAG: RNA-binding protein [Aureispira sp.]|nr:RNA-binding protein [Aureispira sp.]
MNIFVAKLDYSTYEDTLQSAFEGFGQVDSVKIIMDRETGRSKGFGFVEMPDEDEAREAINNLDGALLDGRNIVVKQAEDRRNNNRGGGGYGNNRGGGGGYSNRNRY